MSGNTCTCNTSIKNLGLPGCTELFGIPKRLIFVPTYKDDGTLNYIDTTTFAFTQAAWDALQYASDQQSRYYPLPFDIEAVEMAKEDSVYNTYPSGLKKFVREGVRSFMGKYPGLPPALIEKLKTHVCSKHSVFIVDNNGNFGGIEKSTGLLYPMQLSDNTLSAIYGFATDTVNSEIILKFEFAQNVQDEKISFIPAANLGTSVDMFTTFNGKVDTNITQLAANRSTTTFTVDILTEYGNAFAKIPVTGLVTADFTVYNVTDSTSETLTSATESTTVPGRYAFVLSGAETATDILRLGLATTTAAKPFAYDSWVDVQIALQ